MSILKSWRGLAGILCFGKDYRRVVKKRSPQKMRNGTWSYLSIYYGLLKKNKKSCLNFRFQLWDIIWVFPLFRKLSLFQSIFQLFKCNKISKFSNSNFSQFLYHLTPETGYETASLHQSPTLHCIFKTFLYILNLRKSLKVKLASFIFRNNTLLCGYFHAIL